MPHWTDKPTTTPLADLRVVQQIIAAAPTVPWPSHLLGAEGEDTTVGVWRLRALRTADTWTGTFWAERHLAVGQWVEVGIDDELDRTRLYVQTRAQDDNAGGWVHTLSTQAPPQEDYPC